MKLIIDLARRIPRISHLNNGDFLLISTLFLLQIADGTLTAYGIHLEGGDIALEGNPIIREAMYSWGIIPALFVFKSIACIILVLVYNICKSMGGTTPLARGAIYLTLYCYLFAVVGWILIITGLINYV